MDVSGVYAGMPCRCYEFGVVIVNVQTMYMYVLMEKHFTVEK